MCDSNERKANEVSEFFNIEVLAVICSIMQIAGLVLIIGKASPAFICASGFAAVVKVFLPVKSCRNPLTYIAGACGLALFVMYGLPH